MCYFCSSMKETFSFPQYRKYSNDKSFFKIISTDQFEELQIIGQKFNLHSFEVKILPDRNFMSDLLENQGNRWVVIDGKEYELKLTDCRDNLSEI